MAHVSRRRLSHSPNDATAESPPKMKLESQYSHLLSFDDLPEWCRDNKYIRQGYRPVSGSVATSFGSLLYIHNESVNIYSHLIPAVAFAVGEGSLLRYIHATYPNATFEDDLIFTCFIFTAVLCLSVSACYHTLTNHSEDVDRLWLRIDFVGIIALTIGDFVSGIYMVFWCEPIQRMIYWSMIIILGVLDISILANTRFQGHAWRRFRVLCFVGTGLSGFAPLIHGTFLFGFSQMTKQSGILYYLAEGAVLGLGALVYATRFPEYLSPGKFDIYGASHQLFHLLVVLATGIQLAGILSAYEYNYNNRACGSRMY